MSKDNETITNPSTIAMVASINSSPHKDGEKVSEMVDEYQKNLINKDQSSIE